MATETTNVVKYGSRTFGEMRADLIALIRQQYPDVLSDFTDSSVGAMLIDLNAGVGNNLAINTDRAFQETQLDYAQQRASILNIAKNMGFNIPSKRPSVTVVDFTVTVPVSGDQPDSSYYPIIAPGAQVVGGGQTFETQDSIDFSSPVSNLGDKNCGHKTCGGSKWSKDYKSGSDGTPFHQFSRSGRRRGIFPGRYFGDKTMMEVLWSKGHEDPHQLGAHIIAAYLNAKTIPDYGMTPSEVVNMYDQLRRTGYYQAGGHRMSAEEVVMFIQNTFSDSFSYSDRYSSRSR